MNKKDLLLTFALLIFSSFFLYSFISTSHNTWLRFSDGAKYADVARNIVQGEGYISDFSFFNINLFRDYKSIFSARGIPLGMPYAISFAFMVFGISDFAVMATSSLFYLLLVLAVYFLGKQVFSPLVGFLAGLAVSANINFLDYGTSGASESLFSFLCVVSTFLIFKKSRLTNFLFLPSLVLIYLTRPQGVVFILALVFSWAIYNFSFKKGILLFIVSTAFILLVDRYVLYPLSFKLPVYPVVTRGVQALFQYSPSASVSNALRGESPGIVAGTEVLKKAVYNLYNFYKLLPQIANPYMWGLFAIGLCLWDFSKRKESVYKILCLILTVGSFTLAALTIPFYRYLHPTIPFVYIVSSGVLVSVLDKSFNRKYVVKFISILLVFVFVVGQTLGVIFLDSRFSNKNLNTDKPPVYLILSKLLKENTNPDDLIVTNLDTWGSWYGERHTVWFPLTPKFLIDAKTGEIPFDAIYLTSYLIDDENYYMGNDWRQIFENPNDETKWICEGCLEIAKRFKFQAVFKIDSPDNYQNINAKSVLLIKE